MTTLFLIKYVFNYIIKIFKSSFFKGIIRKMFYELNSHELNKRNIES